MRRCPRRKCQRCRKVASALYTVWKESGSYEDREELCGDCLSEHNRTAPELRGLRVAQGLEPFEVPTLTRMVRRQAAVDQVEAALAAQEGGGR